ncbi:hypothetical protein E2P81_ATG08494 [Venturia nashicola]|nr:hypothetical protein E2P81_ATG08494 [Venturia nashicola]
MLDIGSEVGIDPGVDIGSDLGTDFVPGVGYVLGIDSHHDIPETDSALDTDSVAPVPDSTAVLHFAVPDDTAVPGLEDDNIDSAGFAAREAVRQFAGYFADCFADVGHLGQL